jgi:signal transduction histidine kinase
MRKRPVPAKARVEAKPPVPRQSQKHEDARVRDLENRLAEALKREAEALKRESEVLEQQTATSEILHVISSSPADLEPVARAIADSAFRLCECTVSAVFRFDGELIHWVAARGASTAQEEALRTYWPSPANHETITGRTILARETLHIHDAASDPNYGLAFPATRAALAIRSDLSVPMLRNGQPVGVIGLIRTEVRPFSEREIALIQTFADQAVIAIENVRLFKELETKNRDLTTTLDQQTATSAILRVISGSPTDVQPVFDAITRSAVSLCNGMFSAVFQFDGRLLHWVADHNITPEAREAARRTYPVPLHRQLSAPRAILERAVVHIPDVGLDPEYDPALAQVIGARSMLAVPMLRDETPIGAIWVARSHGAFSQKQITLLQTFAAQAVIAIENVRLFKELEARTDALTRSVKELRALGEVSRAISSTLDLATVLYMIVSRAIQLSGTDAGTIWEYDEVAEEFHLRAAQNFESEIVAMLRAMPLRRGEGSLGRLADTRAPIQIADISDAEAYRGRLDVMVRAGYRAVLVVPLLREEHLIGALTVNGKTARAFASEVVDLLTTFGTQSALAIQNAHLFREIEEKRRELEAASRHKSEFLANMSHELRTPLNAIIGFSEVLTDRMFGELNEKQEEYLKDIYSSGTHLLSLINDILDLSKIEAGRMELELTEFDLPTAIENALMLVRERAGRRSIALHTAIDNRLGQVQADERKVRQVVLNLLSNAIKFTPEGGRIDVGAVPKDGSVEVSVSDTGIGIAPEDQENVFEEFRQVGTAAKKVEGTGLGLTLCRKFVELHGGRIWVKSELRVGSTFTFTIPVQRGV